MELEIHGCRVQNKVEYTVRFNNGVKCYNCHKLGYFTRDCPTVQRKQYTKKQTSDDEDEDEQGEQGNALSFNKGSTHKMLKRKKGFDANGRLALSGVVSYIFSWGICPAATTPLMAFSSGTTN